MTDRDRGASLMPSRSSRGCRAGMGGCWRASASWTASGGRHRRRCHARVRIGCGMRAERLEQDLARYSAATRPMSSVAETAVDRLGRTLAGNRLPSHMSRQRSRRATVNLSDPDTHLMKGHRRFVQGYNAQAVVTENQIVIAAEITTEPVDFSALEPMMTAARRELTQASVTTAPAGCDRRRRVLERAAHGPARRLTGSRCWSRRTPANAKGSGRAGRAGATSGCERLLASDHGGRSTGNENRRSSRCSVTPNTTASSPSFTAAAAPRCAPSGGYR